MAENNKVVNVPGGTPRLYGYLADETIAWLQSQSQLSVAFSTGKDCLLALALMCEAGLRPKLLYMEWVPGLEYLREYLEYISSYFGGLEVHITEHFQTYDWIQQGLLQTPARKQLADRLIRPYRWASSDQIAIPRNEYHLYWEWWREIGWDPNTSWMVEGVRQADNFARLNNIRKHGWRVEKWRVCFPIHDFMTIEEMAVVLKRVGVKLSPDYAPSMSGRSLCGFEYKFSQPLKRFYPRDYARIKKWFPLVDVEEYRVKWALKHGWGVEK